MITFLNMLFLTGLSHYVKFIPCIGFVINQQKTKAQDLKLTDVTESKLIAD